MPSKMHCRFVQWPDYKQELAVTRISAGEHELGQLQNTGKGRAMLR